MRRIRPQRAAVYHAAVMRLSPISQAFLARAATLSHGFVRRLGVPLMPPRRGHACEKNAPGENFFLHRGAIGLNWHSTPREKKRDKAATG
jgi:hypothetical protein